MIDMPASQLVPIDSLRTHPENPRRGNVEAIRASIRESGFYGAVIVQQSTRYILAGNHRWQAARLEGMLAIPAILLDVDDRQARQILLGDNRTSDLGEYDQAALAGVLMNLAALDSLAGTGYSSDDLSELLTSLSFPAMTSETTQLPLDEWIRQTPPGSVTRDVIAKWAEAAAQLGTGPKRTKKEGGLEAPKSAKGRPVAFTEDQRLVIDVAIAQVRGEVEDAELPEGRALELVVADWLSGANR